MPYCYACRNSKPATHAHFTDHGILALRPPKRHITEIEALWDSMTHPEQARALEEGRQFLARAQDNAPAHRSAGTAGEASGKNGEEEGQEGEGSPWGLLAIGALVLGGIGWLFWQGRQAVAP